MGAGARKFGLARHGAVSAAAFLPPAGPMAVFTCRFRDGLFTLATIPIDGGLTDWAAVHAASDN